MNQSNNYKQQQYSYVFKFIIIGDTGVGKSCLLLQFIDNRFRLKHEPTIGVQFGAKTIAVKDKIIKLQVWDTAGQQSFRSITRGYYRSAAGAILVFDVTNPDSFENLTHWLQETRNSGNADMNFLLVGNKSDLQIDRKVDYDEAQKFASQNNMIYIEASAKTGQNVELSFQKVAEAILSKIERGDINIDLNPPGIKIGQTNKGVFDTQNRVKSHAKNAKSKCCE